MTSLNIVAHPDDDLLFLNPDILQDIERGYNVWILYMTYGDDGNDKIWRQKMEASKNAYPPQVNLMWQNIRSNSFRNGNLHGDIFGLYGSTKYVANTMFGHVLDRDDVIFGIQQRIGISRPSIIRTHDPDVEAAVYEDSAASDHIDHIYTAKFVVEAAKAFPMIPVFGYTGYPIRYLEPNVSPELSAKKLEMWRKYQEIDTTVSGEVWDIAMPRMYRRQIQ